MEYVNLGKTGLKVSRLCLGMMTYGSKKWREWVLEEEEARPFVKKSLDAGINFFDTADVYSLGASEEVLGNTLRHLKVRRQDVVVATKVFNSMSDDPNDHGLSRKHILDSIDASLRRLQMDYVDLYQIHRWDYDTPIEETLEALNDVVRAGKARYIGASSMYAWQFAKALFTSDMHGWARFVSMQPHYNLIYREEEVEMLPLCLDQKIAVIPWSPLARGVLTRKPAMRNETLRAQTDGFGKRLYSDEDMAIVQRVSDVAEGGGLPMAQVVLAWMLTKPAITCPIIGATKMEHLEDAVAALSVKLTPDEVKQLEETYRPHPVLGHS